MGAPGKPAAAEEHGPDEQNVLVRSVLCPNQQSISSGYDLLLPFSGTGLLVVLLVASSPLTVHPGAGSQSQRAPSRSSHPHQQLRHLQAVRQQLQGGQVGCTGYAACTQQAAAPSTISKSSILAAMHTMFLQSPPHAHVPDRQQ
jgi:hypothetical protein